MSILVLTPIEDELDALSSALAERGVEGYSMLAGYRSGPTTRAG
ncbi:MAG: hypothetical protein QGI33_05960 [Candidatus Brocadiia bacterium]|nr:hypothetical protein [Candidatus Brocadiia bacterium]